MKKLINTLLLFLMFCFVFAQTKADNTVTSSQAKGAFEKVGAAGAQFLKIGVGARANGMAGAFAGVGGDLSSLYWNPAGIAQIKGIAANFSYTQWFANFGHSFAAASMPLGDRFAVALQATAFNSDRIPVTTVDAPEGTGTYYTVSDMAIGATFAGYLTDQFSFGVTAKYINNSFSSLSSNGVAFDIGTLYETGIQGIRLAFSIHNLGTQQSYSGQDLKTTQKIVKDMNASPLDAEYLSSPYSIPLTFRAGVASDVYTNETSKVTAAFDFVTTSDVPDQFAIGAEYTWNDFVSVRGGYRIGNDQFGLAGGVGLKYIGGGFEGMLDYSINPTTDLGLVNRLSVNIAIK